MGPMMSLLTRVDLLSLRRRINVYLRFGRPARMQTVDLHRRFAYFLPRATLCRIWWERNDYGTTRWELAVLQAPVPSDTAQSVVGVTPGAHILLLVSGPRLVKRTLSACRDIEHRGIALSDVSPNYWRVLHNRLTGGAEAGCYDTNRHVAAIRRKQLQ